MAGVSLDPRAQRGEELQTERRAEADYSAFLQFRRADGAFCICPLPATGRIVVGRDESADVVIDDEYASGAHAKIKAGVGKWFIEDTRSENGTGLNGELLYQEEQLIDRDLIEVGDRQLIFRTSKATGTGTRRRGGPRVRLADLREMDRQFLAYMCEPMFNGTANSPRPLDEIAGAMHVVYETARQRLHKLADLFGVPPGHPSERSPDLARRAMRIGIDAYAKRSRTRKRLGKTSP